MPLKIHTDPSPLRLDLGDVVRVGDTRVTLNTVIYQFECGACPEEIVLHYPTLRLADVYATIAYYLRHRTEVDEYLREERAEEDRIEKQVRAQQDMQGIRQRLEARRGKIDESG